MRALLVHPPTPPTYWGFQHSLPIAGKAASLPPLGLLSLAALLPADWELKVVDENVEPLSDDALRWADAVLVTGMLIHASGIRRAPAPRFELIDHRRYASMSVQYSRGCPFQCEFCDIIEVFGRKPRTKTPAQVLAELDRLRATGYRGSVFFVDDNFIGNRVAVAGLLPHVRAWQEKNDFPFEFYTEASVDLATRPELVDSMVSTGFTAVFLGIETPSAEPLN